MDLLEHESFARYVGQLIHWAGAEWRHVFHGGPDPGPPPLPTTSSGPTPPPSPPLTSGTIAWTIAPNAADLVTDAELAAFVKASNADLDRLRTQWPHVQQWTHVALAAGSAVPTGAVPATLVSTLPEAPDALAYHSADDNGRNPFIRVGVKVCLDNGVSWQSAADHETKELTVDPGCQLTVTDPKTGWVWALEVADPVESSSYVVDGVQLSDSVGPAFFGQGPGELDLLGDAHAAFTIASGGYAVIDKGDGQGPQSIFGEKFPEFRRRHVRSLERMGTARRRNWEVAREL